MLTGSARSRALFALLLAFLGTAAGLVHDHGHDAVVLVAAGDAGAAQVVADPGARPHLEAREEIRVSEECVACLVRQRDVAAVGLSLELRSALGPSAVLPGARQSPPLAGSWGLPAGRAPPRS